MALMLCVCGYCLTRMQMEWAALRSWSRLPATLSRKPASADSAVSHPDDSSDESMRLDCIG